jgi:hypothetical protein
VNASATLNSSKCQAELEAASTIYNTLRRPQRSVAQVANLRIEGSQNLPERKLQ